MPTTRCRRDEAVSGGAFTAVPPAVTMDEARNQLRLANGADDAVLAALLSSATAICEDFTGCALVSRPLRETLGMTGQWQRLPQSPVTAITLVEGIPAEGPAFPLPVASYAIDIDPNGDGWVRVSQPGAAGRVRVSYMAGAAADASSVPDGLRQGIIMLAAHLHRERDRAVPLDPPAAVAALWRPWRRMRLV